MSLYKTNIAVKGSKKDFRNPKKCYLIVAKTLLLFIRPVMLGYDRYREGLTLVFHNILVKIVLMQA